MKDQQEEVSQRQVSEEEVSGGVHVPIMDNDKHDGTIPNKAEEDDHKHDDGEDRGRGRQCPLWSWEYG